jgi:hypothetical protein
MYYTTIIGSTIEVSGIAQLRDGFNVIDHYLHLFAMATFLDAAAIAACKAAQTLRADASTPNHVTEEESEYRRVRR